MPGSLGSLVVSLALQNGPYVKGLDQSDKRANQFARNQNRAFNSVASSAASAAKKLIGAFGALKAGQAFVRITDQYTQVTAQLKLATRSQEEYNQAYQNSIRISQTAQAAIEPIANLYARVTNATREMGANQASVAAITEATALALKVSGATAEESSSAILQLSQALGSGVLRGEEFNAVNEAAPRLMKALAESMDVPIGQLRDMAKEGQLTADVVGNALIESLEDLRKEAKQTQTIAGAFTTIKNRLFLLVGEMGNALNASSGMASAMQTLGDATYFLAKGALRFLATTVVSVVAGFKKLGIAAVAIWDSLSLLTKGDFSGAADAFNNMNVEARKLDAETKKTINNIFAVSVTTEKATGSVKRLHAAQTQVTEEVKKEAEARKKAAAQALKAYQDQIKSISERADKLAFEEATYGLLPSAITEVTIARKKDEKAALSAHGKSTALIEQEIEALERLRDVQSGQEFRKELREQNRLKEKSDREAASRAKKLMQQQQEDWIKANEANLKASQNMLKQYSSSITDAIFRGFEDGKGLIQNFKDTLINTFKTLILRPRIEAIVGGVLGGFGGAANASGVGNIFGGAAGQAGGGIDLTSIGSIYKGITSGFDSLNTGFAQSIEKVGSFLVDQGFDKLGSAIWTNSGQISQALGAAGSLYSAYNFIKDGNTAGAIATGIGYAIGGPVGGALGSLVGGLFGGKEQPPRSLGFAVSEVNDGQLSTLDNYNPFSKKHDLSSDVYNALVPASEYIANTVSAINSAVGLSGDVRAQARYSGRADGSSYKHLDVITPNGDAFISSYKGKFGEDDLNQFLTDLTGKHLANIIQQLQLPAQVKTVFEGVADPQIISGITSAITNLNNSQDQLIKTFGLTTDSVYQITEQFELSGGAFAQFVNDLTSTAGGLTKVSTQILNTKNAVIDTLTFLPGVESIADYDKFIKATAEGGDIGAAGLLLNSRANFAQYQTLLDQVRGSAESAVFGLRDQEDQKSILKSQAESLFGQFGLSLPTDASELVKIAESIDDTTEAGLDLAVAMPSLVSAFNALNSIVDTTIPAVGTVAETITETLAESIDLNALRSAANDSVFGFRSEASQVSLLQNQVRDMFAEFGLGVPASGEALAGIVDSIDETTDYGRTLLIAVPQLTDAFGDLQYILESTSNVTDIATASLTKSYQARQLEADNFATLAEFRVAQARENKRIELLNNPSLSTQTATTTQQSSEVQSLKQEIETLKNDPTPSEVSMLSLLNRMALVLDKIDKKGVFVNEKNASGGDLTIRTKAA